MAQKNFKVERVYDMADTFKELYTQGQNGKIFNNLYGLIVKDSNILLAMKNIRLSINRHTKGVDGKTISHYEKMPPEKLIQLVKRRLSNFKPMKVRRIFIPKDNGTKRTLGILTFEDRLIQQCIRQVLEPICESKFHPNSFGFRTLRSTRHAVSKMVLTLQMAKYDYCVDIDIKDFFDSVNHEVLINQIYNLGFRDKKLLAIISKMLKANVEGEGTKKVGLIQGGVLSPLLSNIVLNELDWWINSQCKMASQALSDNRIYFVRYADDFKILCKTFSEAFKIFNTVKAWLKENLKLDISSEKSKILNIKTQGTEFLGFKIKATVRNGKYAVESHISDSNKLKIQNKLFKIISRISDSGKNAEKVLQDLNRQIIISQKYYQSASHVQQDFLSISKQCQNLLEDKLKNIAQKVPFLPAQNIMTYKINNTVLIPPEYIVHKKLGNILQGTSIYTNVKKSNVVKFSKTSMKKFNSNEKIKTSKNLKLNEKSKSGFVESIKKSVSDFFLKLSISWQQ